MDVEKLSVGDRVGINPGGIDKFPYTGVVSKIHKNGSVVVEAKGRTMTFTKTGRMYGDSGAWSCTRLTTHERGSQGELQQSVYNAFDKLASLCVKKRQTRDVRPIDEDEYEELLALVNSIPRSAKKEATE